MASNSGIQDGNGAQSHFQPRQALRGNSNEEGGRALGFLRLEPFSLPPLPFLGASDFLVLTTTEKKFTIAEACQLFIPKDAEFGGVAREARTHH
jgi:hypothetical protein